MAVTINNGFKHFGKGEIVLKGIDLNASIGEM